MADYLVRIRNLKVEVAESEGAKVIVERIALDIERGKITALVGASGSGKTTTGLAIIRLLGPSVHIVQGEIFYQDEQHNLVDYTALQMQQLRGKEIGMVFQEPLNAFNPVFTIENQIDEVLRFHSNLNQKQRREKILELLQWVELPEPKRVMKSYPHQLSGGMRQRAMIAQAIAAGPQMIIADEPTSSLDVTLQARIIELFQKLNREMGLTIVLITHDLGMVKHLADNVAVMSQGRIVEQGATAEVLDNPQHQYTRDLLEAVLI